MDRYAKKPLDLLSCAGLPRPLPPTAWRLSIVGLSQPVTETLLQLPGPKKPKPKKTMTLDAHEFIRRFLLHVIPKGFVRVRHFGVWPTDPKTFCQSAVTPRPLSYCAEASPKIGSRDDAATYGIDITRCPLCQKGTLVFLPTCRPTPWDSSLMIAQRTNTAQLAPFSARANASVRRFHRSQLLGPFSRRTLLADASHKSTRMAPLVTRSPARRCLLRRAAMVTIP